MSKPFTRHFLHACRTAQTFACCVKQNKAKKCSLVYQTPCWTYSVFWTLAIERRTGQALSWIKKRIRLSQTHSPLFVRLLAQLSRDDGRGDDLFVLQKKWKQTNISSQHFLPTFPPNISSNISIASLIQKRPPVFSLFFVVGSFSCVIYVVRKRKSLKKKEEKALFLPSLFSLLVEWKPRSFRAAIDCLFIKLLTR